MVPRLGDGFSTGVMTLIRDEEGNHCSSFPTALLQLIQKGTSVSQSAYAHKPSLASHDAIRAAHLDTAIRLLLAARSFDASSWAHDIQTHSPVNDLAQRTCVAHAHRAAVCIYLSRVILSLGPSAQLPQTTNSLISEILTNLAFVRQRDVLFTATTWPTFIAGAETNDPEIQTWVVERFQELWEVEPWGLMKGALEVLERIWSRRRSKVESTEHIDGSTTQRNVGYEDWIGDLRKSGVDWLIL